MRIFAIVLAVMSLSACEKKTGMETRTFELSRLQNDDAMALLTPYITQGGRLSGKNRLITVSEKPERMKVIEDLLKKYDGGGTAVDVALQFQIVAADHYTGHDPAIADVEQTLTDMFKYTGYKLIGDARVQAREDEDFRYVAQDFAILGHVRRLAVEEGETRVPVRVQLKLLKPTGQEQVELFSTVTATPGKPVILGQSVRGGAVILVLRAAIAKR